MRNNGIINNLVVVNMTRMGMITISGEVVTQLTTQSKITYALQ